ncbi:hypothetical protein GGI16_005516, partial [Coemansia sp. S142-1]
MNKALFRLRTTVATGAVIRNGNGFLLQPRQAAVAGLHTSSARYNGGHVSPLKAFADSVRRQVKENQELQENMKLLEDR